MEKEMFEKVSRLKVRFGSEKGLLSVEDLWDLSLKQLNTTAKGLHKQLLNDKEEDFLEEKTKQDKLTKLSFDIVLHIIKTKQEESKKIRDASSRKMEKEKLLTILSKKQDESLENLSEEDLKKKIEELG